MVALELLVLTLGAVLSTVWHGIGTRYHRGHILQASKERGALVPLNKPIGSLPGEYHSMRVPSCFDVDPI